MPKIRISSLAGTSRHPKSTSERLGSPSSFRLFNYAGVGSAVLLAGLPVFLTLSPALISPGASAVGPTNGSGNGIATLSVEPAIAVTAQNVTITATPSPENKFVSTASTVTVKNTGASNGYHLIMSSENGGSLKSSSNNSIGTISGYSKTGTQMKNAASSSWAYTLDTMRGTNSSPLENNSDDLQNTYYPIPVEDTSWNEDADENDNKYAYLLNTTSYTDQENGDKITIGYAFTIAPDTPSGVYTDTITYTAIANTASIPENPTIFDLSTMQDLATYEEACANTPTPTTSATTDATSMEPGWKIRQRGVNKIPTVTLRDTRVADNDTTNAKSYTVKKLADGNC